MLAHCSMRSISAVDSGDISIHLSSFSRATRSANCNASLSIFVGTVIWRSPNAALVKGSNRFQLFADIKPLIGCRLSVALAGPRQVTAELWPRSNSESLSVGLTGAPASRVVRSYTRLPGRFQCNNRIQSDHIPITDEFLAMMLGTRRSSVTVAAGTLHKAGLIAYSRGHVTIQDREGLRHAACECYEIVYEEYVRLGLL